MQKLNQKIRYEFRIFRQQLSINIAQNLILSYKIYNIGNNMFTIKVSRRGKNIILGKGMDSLQKIYEEIRSRFPPQQFPHGIVLKYQGNPITQFSQIEGIQSVSASGNKAIKLEAEVALPKQLSAISEIKSSSVTLENEFKKEQMDQENALQKQIIQSIMKQEQNNVKEPAKIQNSFVNSQSYSEQIKNESKFCQQKIKKPSFEGQSQDNDQVYGLQQLMLREVEPGVYECIFCKSFESCNICDRKRKILPNSKFSKLVNKIVEKKIYQKCQEMQQRILNKILNLASTQKVQNYKCDRDQQKQAKIGLKQISADDILTNTFEIKEIPGQKQVYSGQEFKWAFEIKSLKPLQTSHEVVILNERTGQTKDITLKDETKVEVGPFIAQKQGKFDKTYRLCIHKQGERLRPFGPKFGFSVSIINPKSIKRLTNTLRQVVDQIRKDHKVGKTTEFVMEKLKEMGITEENFEENKNILADIIQIV